MIMYAACAMSCQTGFDAIYRWINLCAGRTHTQVADRPRSIKAIEKNGNNINNSKYSHISRGKISENCSKAIAFSF